MAAQEFIEEVERTTGLTNGAGPRRPASPSDTAMSVLLLLARAFSSRVLVFATVASCLGMVWWTVTHPTTLTIIANAPGLLILTAVLWHDARSGG